MDIDFLTDLSKSFDIAFDNTPSIASGNRALLNRFEVVMLTGYRQFQDQYGDVAFDNFGGNAPEVLGIPRSINNIQAVTGSIGVIIEQTIEALKNDQWQNIPDTEKLKDATLVNVLEHNGVIEAIIDVIPVEAEVYTDLQFRLPITRR